MPKILEPNCNLTISGRSTSVAHTEHNKTWETNGILVIFYGTSSLREWFLMVNGCAEGRWRNDGWAAWRLRSKNIRF